MWTACGDSIVRAFDAKSGALKRQFVGHEAAVNCMVIVGGKLYTGSSDGTLRVWDAKEISDEMMDDTGAPPPAPVEEGGEAAADTTGDAPAEESEAVPDADQPAGAGEETVEDIENAEGGEEAPAEGEEAPAEGEDAPAAEEGAEDAPAEDDAPKDDTGDVDADADAG